MGMYKKRIEISGSVFYLEQRRLNAIPKMHLKFFQPKNSTATLNEENDQARMNSPKSPNQQFNYAQNQTSNSPAAYGSPIQGSQLRQDPILIIKTGMHL